MRPTAILAMSGASVNARARTRRGLKNEHPCSVPGRSWASCLWARTCFSGYGRRQAAASRRTCFGCALLRYIVHSGAGALGGTNPCFRYCKCRGGASSGGATAGIQSDDCRTYPSNHRSKQNRDGNDAYVASEGCGQTKATELGMNISSQG